MAKKKPADQRPQPAPAASPQGGPEAALAAGDLPPAIEQPVPEPVTTAHVLSFWGVVLALALTAWLLDYFMPGLRERDVERWLMLPFGLFLLGNLARLR